MIADPNSEIHWIDYSPRILRDLDDARSYCSWLATRDEQFLEQIELSLPFFANNSTRADFSPNKVEEIIVNAHEKMEISLSMIKANKNQIRAVQELNEKISIVLDELKQI